MTSIEQQPAITDAESQQFIAALAAAHDAAVEKRQTIAAQRASLGAQALTLAETLTATARRHDDDLTQALRALAAPLEACRAREDAGEPTEWRRDVAPLVDAISDTATLFRAEFTALAELTAQYVARVGGVITITQAEIDARAAELVAVRNVTLATEAARFLVQ